MSFPIKQSQLKESPGKNLADFITESQHAAAVNHLAQLLVPAKQELLSIKPVLLNEGTYLMSCNLTSYN